MFQINLRPFYDENQTQAQCTVDGVTGVCAQLVPFGGIGTLGLTTELLLPGLKHLSTDSRYTNNVQLFYMFAIHNPGQPDHDRPVELEEFFISFYDFDQDYADGNRS